MADFNNQFNAALASAEAARQKAQQDAERHAAEIAARNRYHQELAARASQMSPGPRGPSFTADVQEFASSVGQRAGYGLMAAGAHAYSNAATGAAYLGANIQQGGRSLAAAVGMGDYTFTGPRSRGMAGPYMQAGQSFPGLLYEAGVGQALNTITGGLLFRDYNEVVGMPKAAIAQRAGDELSMRARSVGNAFLEGLPKSSFLNMRFAGMASDTRRDVAQRLSFVTGGDLAGGRGFSAMGGVTTDILESLESSGRRHDRARGFSLSKEEESSFRNATMNMFDTPELQRLATSGTSTNERKRKFSEARNVVTKLTDDLRISAAEAEKLTAEFGKMLGPDVMGKLSSAARRTISGGSAGGLSGSQVMDQMIRQQQVGFRMGMGDEQATKFGETFMAERGAILAQRRAGLMTTGDLYMYGGSNADEAATRHASRNREIALRGGMGDPGRAGMYANQAGSNYMNQLAAGANKGGTVGMLSAQANNTVSDPYASLRAQYDPDAKQRAATTGRLAAFQAAKQQAQFTHMFKSGDPAVDRKNSRALGIQAFQQSTGIEDPVEAARQYDMMEMTEREFGDSKKAFLYNEMQQVGAEGMDLEKAKKVIDNINEAVGGDINKFANATDIEKRQMINEARVLDVGLTEQEKKSVNAGLDATANAYGNAAPMKVTEEMRQREQAAELDKKYNISDLKEPTGVLTGILAGAATGAAAGAGFLGIGALPGAIVGAVAGGAAVVTGNESKIEDTVKKLMDAGAPPETINATIEKFGYFVTPDGDLRSNDDPQRSRASYTGVSDDVANAVADFATEAAKTGKIPKAAIAGAELSRSRQQVRETIGMSVGDYFDDNEDLQKKIGVKKTENNYIDDNKYGFTQDSKRQLMSDKDFLADMKKAAEMTGDKELLEDLESGRQADGKGTKEAAFNRLMASDKLNEAMVNIRVEREAGITKAAPLGSSKDKPMFVKEA